MDSSPLVEPDADHYNFLLQQLMHRSTTSITQRKKNLKKSGKWDRLETEIVQADVTSPNRQRVVVSQLANLRARLAQGNGN